MFKTNRISTVAALLVCLLGSTAWACRFNVRETGFVDLQIEPYYLFAYVDADTPNDVTTTLEETLDAELFETNLVYEIVNVDEDPNHPAIGFLQSRPPSAYPAAVLLSPDGQYMPIVLDAAADLPKAVSQALDRVLVSPARKKILDRVASVYGIILLLEGPDATANAKAKEAALAAVEEVKGQLEFMPKPIEVGAELVVLDAETVAAEKVLLWSLELTAKDVNEPHALIMYGRGRWLGPMFVGEQITEDNLLQILFVIGQDCECGLDHRWLQGTMIPARWNETLHAKAVESLGFDPENPMIKMEIAHIVRRGMGGYGYRGPSFGYRELEIDTDTLEEPNDANTTPIEHAPRVLEPNEPRPAVHPQPAVAPEPADEGSWGMGGLVLLGGGVSAAVVVAGMLVFLGRKGA